MSVKPIKDHDIQNIIGWILRLGVVISISIVFIGGCVYLYRHGHSTVHYTVFNGVPDFVHTLPGIWNGIITGRGQAIIQAGIILLISTPVVRVIFSALGFVIEKDWLYTGLTLLVLTIIIVSAFSGHGG